MVPDSLPLDAVFLSDLCKVISFLDGVGVHPAAGSLAAGGEIKYQVARSEIRVEAIVFIPQLLFGLGAGCRPRNDQRAALALGQFVSGPVLISKLKKRLIFFLC